VELGKRLDGSGNAENFRKIAETAKSYIGGTRIKQSEIDDFSNYIDRLMADTTTTKANASNNIRALFYKVQSFGGFRGAKWVLVKSKKKGLN
jgi:hypothetical protein